MHIAEGFLPVAHCVAWYAASAPFVIHGARKVIEQAEHLSLTERDSLRVLDALENPPAPNARLQRAARSLPHRK